jgi:hypothetical protein
MYLSFVTSVDPTDYIAWPVCCSKRFGLHELRKLSASPFTAWMPSFWDLAAQVGLVRW